jgi:hypothetical protein
MAGLAAMSAPGAGGGGIGAGNFRFNSNAPGGGAQVGGYNAAIQALNKSLQASQNTTNAQSMQLSQQLQNNQGRLSQSLASRGLGNTTIANTMQQAPLQTYNLGQAQVGDLNAMRQMQGYDNLAGMLAQGGNAITGTAQPYAQTNFLANLMASMQPAPQSPGMPGFGPDQQGAPVQQAPTGPLSFGPGFGGGQGPVSPAQAALATQYRLLMGAGQGQGDSSADVLE